MIVQSAFKPAWWLANCHLQTLYPALFRTVPDPPLYRRERLITPDGDFLDVDFCGPDSGPWILLLHGLTGSSRSGYIKGLQRVFSAQGWRSAALNFRGCSGISNNRARCYHSGETEDIHFLYRTLREREPETPMAAAGFSLGGNVLVKWLGEQGPKLDLFSAVAVSVPLVLNLCADKLDTGLSKLYRNNLLTELKTYLRRKARHLEAVRQAEEALAIRNLGDLAAIRSFWEYDDRVVAKLHGFKDVHDYYRRASSRQFLQSIAVPTLLIQARDDPFMTAEVIPGASELADCVSLEVTPGGGHVGFISGNVPFRPEYWLERRIPEFLADNLTAAVK